MCEIETDEGKEEKLKNKKIITKIKMWNIEEYTRYETNIWKQKTEKDK